MKSKILGAALCVFLLSGVAAEAATLRVVVVQTSDAAAYVKAVQDGQALLKSKGSPATLRVWKARFAGTDAGAIAVAVEYPNLEALAKDNDRMANDPELRAWLQGLDKLRKIVSDSIYEELGK
jgi:hypothetical protein